MTLKWCLDVTLLNTSEEIPSFWLNGIQQNRQTGAGKDASNIQQINGVDNDAEYLNHVCGSLVIRYLKAKISTRRLNPTELFK